MVAYSFMRRFVAPIQMGLCRPWHASEAPAHPKRQTIRAAGKKRHARPGEAVQLYHAMRSTDCFLIGVGRCTSVRSIMLRFGERAVFKVVVGVEPLKVDQLDDFARRDGFADWDDLSAFWAQAHGDVVRLGGFRGLLIEWEPLAAAAEAA